MKQTYNIKEDFHGWKLEDAKQTVEQIISNVRMVGGEIVNAEFITGHGVIQTELLILLRNKYNLDARVSWSNSGVITVSIE